MSEHGAAAGGAPPTDAVCKPLTRERAPKFASPRVRKTTIVAALALASLLAALVWIVQSKVAADTRLALQNFRAVAEHSAHEAAEVVEDKLRQIRQGLRTISLLPSVRSISRHGENIDEDDLQTIQLSTAATNCARWRRESVPVWLKEKGREALASCVAARVAPRGA